MRWPPAWAPQVATECLDVVVVPGIAFDRSGGRLGQGGGWYDRALAALCPRAVVIGVCFECQLAATSLPFEEHDRRAGVVLTETQTLYASHSVT
jgi:5-formyltetrahydrofolate cyclo-ligase